MINWYEDVCVYTKYEVWGSELSFMVGYGLLYVLGKWTDWQFDVCKHNGYGVWRKEISFRQRSGVLIDIW
jgi:hypothetical protein